MPRALLALCAICGALVWPAVGSAGGTDRDLIVSPITYPFDPCNLGNDLSVGFAGLSTMHVNVQNDWAKVSVSQSGLITTTINNVLYVGALNYASKTNLNNQNSVQTVSFAVAASSLDGLSHLAFGVVERVTFNASDPLTPVAGTTEITTASCPS